jgi:hypothetical protein
MSLPFLKEERRGLIENNQAWRPRPTPDPLEFAFWAAAHLEFKASSEHRAEGVWNHWSDHARKHGVEAGCRRTLRRRLAKIGCPAERSRERKKVRYYQGFRLTMPDYHLPADSRWDEATRLAIEVDILLYNLKRYG